MHQTYPLDTVIRRVDKGTQANPPAEKKVTIDWQTKKAVPRAPLLGEVKYYLVSNTFDSQNVAEGRSPVNSIRDFANDRTIGIYVKYQVSCDSGNEEKVAEALCDGTHPGDTLNKLIGKWIMEYARGKTAELIDNYDGHETALKQYLTTKALDEVGLNLHARLLLHQEELLRSLSIGPLNFSVRFSDYDDYHEYHKIRITADLDIDRKNKAKAILNLSRTTILEELVKNGIQSYLAKNISLRTFYPMLDSGDLKKELTNYLTSILLTYGRKLDRLSIEYTPPGDVKAFFEMEHDVTINVGEYPEPLIVSNKLQMALEDIGKYRLSKSPDLKMWVSGNLERLVHDLLFYAKYVDILTNFKPIETKIKQEMEQRAKAIGYIIKHLIILPEIKIITVLTRPFTIVADGTFATKVDDIPAELAIVVTAKFNHLEDVADYLNRQEDVRESMKKSILEETEQFLHTLDPERLFMNFDYSHDPKLPPVGKELIDLISKRLKGQYKANVISVTPKVRENELMVIFNKLRASLCDFEVEIQPLESEDTIKFFGTFQVEAVDSDGWHKFNLRRCTVDEIREYLQKNIKAKLEPFDVRLLQYREIEHLKLLQIKINELARKSIIQGFGLIVTITNLFRERTEIEALLLDAEKKRRMDAIKQIEAERNKMENRLKLQTRMASQIDEAKLAHLQKLINMRAEIATLPGNEDEIEMLDKEIESLQNAISTQPSTNIDQHINQLKNKIPEKIPLSDMEKLLALPNSRNKEIDNKSTTNKDDR